MGKLTFAAAGLIVASVGGFAAAQDVWKPVAAGGMSVSMPCTADWNTSTQEVPEEASVVTTHVLACKTTDSFYLLSWSEVETRAQFDGMAAIRSFRDAMLKSSGNALLISSGDIELDGLKGIEFTGNLRDTLLLSGRGVFRGKRIYSISVGTPIKQDRSADTKRFLTSLKISR
jgi:hypothetical protein